MTEMRAATSTRAGLLARSLPVNLRDSAKWSDWMPNWASTLGLIVLAAVFGIINPVFLSIGNIQAILLASAIPIVLSLGQTFVIATAGIDLSVAAAMTFGAVVLGWTTTQGWPIWLACLSAIIASACVGIVNGILVAKGRITDFIVTLGTLSAASAAALIIAQGNPVQVNSDFLLHLATGSSGIFGYPLLVAVGCAIIAHVLLFHTRFGLHVLATGGQPESAQAMGVRTGRVKVAVYTIAGVLAGVAAILLVARLGAAEPAMDTSYLLNSVAAVVLGGVSLFGGRGTIIGPVMGAILLSALINGLTLLGVSQFYQPLAVGIVVILAALAMRSKR